jgi:protein SCO1
VRRIFIVCVIGLTVAAAGCSRGKKYPFVGQVIAVDVTRQEITVKHEDIRGFMPGMTMAFKVKDESQVKSSKPGDLITATLVVEDGRVYLEDVKKTGEAPLPDDTPRLPAPMIQLGAEVPDAEFIDQDGSTRHLADWRGKVVAVTFTYTRCPLPDFCPLMDRNYAAVQKALQADPRLAARVHLLSVSFDPDYDTPGVLKKHAERVKADPALWTYLTGSRGTIDAFAAGFGVAVMRQDTVREIVHNLRTGVIDADGTLVKVLGGNDWQPAQLLDAIRAADAEP